MFDNSVRFCLFQALTKLGQKIVDIDLNKNVISEVLRIFVVARNGGSCQVKKSFVSIISTFIYSIISIQMFQNNMHEFNFFYLKYCD